MRTIECSVWQIAGIPVKIVLLHLAALTLYWQHILVMLVTVHKGVVISACQAEMTHCIMKQKGS
ncbi:hypothetical protein [Filimonas lacunae]|uniref:hypothetical protein n=1 Tax=Filimonas lacunae TaxID=477680 RepID=UPI00097022F4|nr:hypothetical protein [Filimonas lacunae]